MSEEIEIADASEPVSKGFVVLAPGTIASDFSLKNLNKSLGEAQNEFDDAVKSKINTYGGYGYTPLSGIIAAVRPSLTKFHLTVSQFSVSDLEAKSVTLYSRIVHWDSGEWLQNALELPAQMAIGKDGVLKFNHQTIGGTQTYAQKYAYKAIVGIPDSEEMVDGSDEHGNVPDSKKSKGEVKAAAQRRAQEMVQGARPSAKDTQPVKQQPMTFPGHAGKMWFDGKDILCAPIKNATRCSDEKIEELKQQGRQPWLAVTFPEKHHDMDMAFCFPQHLWDSITDSIGLECYFRVTEGEKNGNKFLRIVDLLAVDGTPHIDGQPEGWQK
jgi:ERF superfamily